MQNISGNPWHTVFFANCELLHGLTKNITNPSVDVLLYPTCGYFNVLSLTFAERVSCVFG